MLVTLEPVLHSVLNVWDSTDWFPRCVNTFIPTKTRTVLEVSIPETDCSRFFSKSAMHTKIAEHCNALEKIGCTENWDSSLQSKSFAPTLKMKKK